jgi:hypothetical protein
MTRRSRNWIASATSTSGGPRASTRNAAVTDVRWLEPTAGNIAQATVTLPPGFHRVSSPASQ